MKPNLFSFAFKPKNKAQAILVILFSLTMWAVYISLNHHCLMESLELLRKMNFIDPKLELKELKSWMPLFLENDFKRFSVFFKVPVNLFSWLPRINLLFFLIVSILAAITIGYPIETIFFTVVKDVVVGKIVHLCQHHLWAINSFFKK